MNGVVPCSRPMVILGGGAVSYERDTPVGRCVSFILSNPCICWQGATRYSWQAPMQPLVPHWDAIPPRASASAPLCLPVSSIWDPVGGGGQPDVGAIDSADVGAIGAAAARGGARLPGYEDCFQGF